MTAQATGYALEDFDRAWVDLATQPPPLKVIYALIGLTALGGRPTTVGRLAAALGKTEDAAAALSREHARARVEDGMVYLDTPWPGGWSRRRLYVGDREISVSGCAPDLFGVAAVLDVPFRVEDTCSITGAPIHVEFAPGGGVERADPPETVVAMLPPAEAAPYAESTIEEINGKVCAQQPFFASAQAAQGWLDQHPGGRVFTVAEMVERPWVMRYRDDWRPSILAHPR